MPTKSTVQVPVITSPIGTMRKLSPGTTNGASLATTKVWIGGSTRTNETMALSENIPVTNVASFELRVVLTLLPRLSRLERVTAGVRTFCIAALERGVLILRSK